MCATDIWWNKIAVLFKKVKRSWNYIIVIFLTRTNDFYIFKGIGFFLGNVLCGIAFGVDGQSLVRVFRLCAGISFLWSCFYFFSQQCCMKKRENKKYLTLLGESDDEDDIYNVSEKPKQSSNGEFYKNTKMKLDF